MRQDTDRRPPAPRLGAAVGCALLALLALVWGTAAAQPAVLYDAGLGTLPDAQGMVYGATDATFLRPPVAATQTYANGAAELKTNTHLGDHAGYTAKPALAPSLDRTAGFTLTFQLQLVAEQHTSTDRAGLSVIVLGADRRGIELGFWTDRVWAQSASPLFTRAEEALLDTTAMSTYELVVRGDTYTLRHGGAAVLSGPVRDYQASTFPVYKQANFIFLGDNTTSGGALVRLVSVAIEAGATATATMTSTPQTPTATTDPGQTASPTPTGTAPSATPSPTATAPGSKPGGQHAVMLPLLARP